MLQTTVFNTLCDNRFCLVFARLSDEMFSGLKDCPELLNDKDFLINALQDDGDHIHIIKGFGNALGLRPLTKELIAQGPKTITFYRDDFERLHYLYGRES